MEDKSDLHYLKQFQILQGYFMLGILEHIFQKFSFSLAQARMPNITSMRRNSTKISLFDSQVKIFRERKRSQHSQHSQVQPSPWKDAHGHSTYFPIKSSLKKKSKPNNPFSPLPLPLLVLTLFSVFSLRSQTI